MEPAHLGVILDSSIMIEAERQRLDTTRFLKLVRERIGERQVGSICGARLPAEPAKDLEAIEAMEQSERSTTLRKLLARVIVDWKLEYQAQLYAQAAHSWA